jgi:hypothetical protein
MPEHDSAKLTMLRTVQGGLTDIKEGLRESDAKRRVASRTRINQYENEIHRIQAKIDKSQPGQDIENLRIKLQEYITLLDAELRESFVRECVATRQLAAVDTSLGKSWDLVGYYTSGSGGSSIPLKAFWMVGVVINIWPFNILWIVLDWVADYIDAIFKDIF